MKRAILSVSLAIAFVVAVSAQDKPNFAGKWQDGFTITVEGSKMTVTRSIAGNSESTFYMLDGTPTKNVIGKGGVEVELTYTSKWEDSVLVTTIVSGNSTRIERRSIEADGTMKLQSTLTIQGKPVTPPPIFLKRVR
jgi:hypothetical protein